MWNIDDFQRDSIAGYSNLLKRHVRPGLKRSKFADKSMDCLYVLCSLWYLYISDK